MDEKNELIAAAKQLPPVEGGFSLRPRTLEEAYRFANLIAESDLVPKEFRGKPANVLVAVQLGMELGVPPMQALQNIAVINGRPSIWGDLLPAIVLQSGLLEEWDEEGDEKQAICTVKRKGMKPITRSFSMEEARKIPYTQWENNQPKRMTLADKDTYKAYPKRMLQMRARAFAFRDRFADVLKGVAIREEIEDIEVTATEVKPLMIPKAVEDARLASLGLKAQNGEHTNSADKQDTGSPAPSEHDGLPDNPTRAPKPNKQQPDKQPKPDIKAQALEFIEKATDEEFTQAGSKWLAATIKEMNQADQLLMCREFTSREQAIKAKAKQELPGT